jgi:hypothetical protein
MSPITGSILGHMKMTKDVKPRTRLSRQIISGFKYHRTSKAKVIT